MKRIIGILGLLALVGCGEQPQAIEEVQSRLFNAVAPARPYGNLVTGNLPGWVTIGAPGGEVPLRPNLGYPAWNGAGLDHYVPPSQCPKNPAGLCTWDHLGDPTYGLTNIAVPTNRVGFGYVYFWQWDERWGFRGYGVNGWANAVPLRTPTLGLPQTGSAYIISDLATTHMNEIGVGQLDLMLMDYYAHVIFCSQPNMTGTCMDFGYTPGGACVYVGGVCHGDVVGGDPSGNLTTIDLTLAAGAGSILAFNPHPSMTVRYGF